MNRTELAAIMDYTLLKPEATAADVAAFVVDALHLGVGAICVSPSMLPVPDAGPVVVATVCGFPSGKHHSEVKADEAARAVSDGAAEVDMVIDIGAAVAGDVAAVQADIAAVRRAIPRPVVLKVILETAVLSDPQITACCLAAEAAGADYVKTSTGFHPAGGASVHAVEVMAAAVGGRLGIKASGGIRTYDQAVSMVQAGATRLGVSAASDILAAAAA